MKRLVKLRNNTAGHDTGLRRNRIFNQARVKPDAGVVDKKLIGSADTGQASVLVHAHKIIGVEILLVVDLLQFKEHCVPQPAAAHGRGGKEKDACARAIRNIIIAVLFFHIDDCPESRKQEPDRVILPRRRRDRTDPAKLRQTVAVDHTGAGAAPSQIIIELLLIFGGDIRSAHKHKLQL